MTARRVRERAAVVRVIVLALTVLAAPTAGNIGSCGQDPALLDAEKFFTLKENVDCRQCRECGLVTEACTAACSPGLDIDAFPPGCVPLVHDGEVCLDALAAASCGDYEGFMAEVGPTVPTECNFCPARLGDEGGGGSGGGP